MKRYFLLCLSIILFGPLNYLFSEEVSAPFVSKLNAIPEGNTIKLKWMDSGSSVNSYSVYRYTERINDKNFSKCVKIGQVARGKGIFIDLPTKKEPFFYAVLASMKNGTLYKLFIPYQNITVQPVQIANVSTPEERAARITDIKTAIFDAEIKITFKCSKPNRNVIIYRSTSPLLEKGDLGNAVAIATVSSEKGIYTDKPIPGIDYYYAVFDDLLSRSGTYIFKTGENVTRNSIKLPLLSGVQKTSKKSQIRTQPLPYLDLNIGIASGKTLPVQTYIFPHHQNLNPKTVTILSSVFKKIPAYTVDSPQLYIFPEDKVTQENSENYQLVRILKTDFANANWQVTKKLLGYYLGIHHSKAVERRTHFYMGEAYYFSGDYHAAFMEFSLIENIYYRETQPWLNSLYFLLRNNK